jgi:hypothetical protein
MPRMDPRALHCALTDASEVPWPRSALRGKAEGIL